MKGLIHIKESRDTEEFFAADSRRLAQIGGFAEGVFSFQHRQTTNCFFRRMADCEGEETDATAGVPPNIARARPFLISS